MRQDIEKYELIENYLKGELSPEEKLMVESQIKSDPGFANLVKQQRSMFELMVNGTLLDLKDNLNRIHSKANRQNNTPSKGNFGTGKLFLIFAAASLLIVSTYLFNKENEVIPEPVKIVHQQNKGVPSTEFSEFVGSPQTDKQTKITKEKNPTPTKKVIQEERSHAKKQAVVENIEVPSESSPFLPENHNKTTTPQVPTPEYKKQGTDQPTSEDAIPQEQGAIDQGSPETNEEPFDCSQIKITAEVGHTKSCDQKATGSLFIKENTISGGVAPYQYSINGGKNFYPNFMFDKLFSKAYEIAIVDANKCKSSLGTYILGSKDCSYSAVLRPSEDIFWKIPTQDKTGNIKIFQVGGAMVYEKDIEFPGIHEWMGLTTNGRELPMGTYIFILTLDGEEPLQGNVTIIR